MRKHHHTLQQTGRKPNLSCLKPHVKAQRLKFYGSKNKTDSNMLATAFFNEKRFKFSRKHLLEDPGNSIEHHSWEKKLKKPEWPWLDCYSCNTNVSTNIQKGVSYGNRSRCPKNVRHTANVCSSPFSFRSFAATIFSFYSHSPCL